MPAANTGLAKVAVPFSADTFVVNQSLVLRINPVRTGWYKSPPSPSDKTLCNSIAQQNEINS